MGKCGLGQEITDSMSDWESVDGHSFQDYQADDHALCVVGCTPHLSS